jgi:ribosome-binding factor A
MGHKRPERVASLVHAELSRLLREEVSDPRIGQLSITHVRLTPDLKRATVCVLPLGGHGDRQVLLQGLEAASGFLRGRLGRNLRLRFAPALVFELDDHLEKAVRMTSMLDRIASEEASEE